MRRSGSGYTATLGTTTYTGTLKSVVQRAVVSLNSAGGGTVSFGAGDFDQGADNFTFSGVNDIVFTGQGIDVTTIRNFTNAARDSEPFSFANSNRITLQDMTVSAGGSLRSTSDAIDTDGATGGLIQRVKVIGSRARGIVYDGKDAGRSAEGNTIRDCIVVGVPTAGIELLGAGRNRIEGCEIRDVGTYGIYLHQASSIAPQPNKPSDENVIVGNRVEDAGQDGIFISSSNGNTILGNTLINNSNRDTARDGIRISTASASLPCNDNVIENNTATDTQSTKTQAYGLRIYSAGCNRTVVKTNNFAGNLRGAIRDSGTGTIYSTSEDTTAPSQPSNLSATAVSAQQVNLSWSASSDSVGVTGYEVFRDGSLLATAGDVTTYTDASVQPGTTYSYQVRARDAAGNRSSLSAAASASTPPSAPTTLTFTAVADAYVKSDAPSTNYGASTSLHADGSPAEHVLLKFDVSGVGTGQVTDAVVRLYNTNSSGRGGDFYVTSTDWSETSVTWSSAPAASGSIIASLGRVTSGNSYQVRVTPVVTEDGLVSFKVTLPSTDGAWYASKENAAGLTPQLIVTVAR